MNKYRSPETPKPAQPQTMQDFAKQDREARLPKIQRRDALVAKQREALKNGR